MDILNLHSFWKTETFEHLETAKRSFESLYGDFEKIIEICAENLKHGGKIMFFGSGGSAAEAQRLSTALTVRMAHDRKPVQALALTADSSTLTAIGDSYGQEHIFARQIDALGHGGDVAFGICPTGNSAATLEGLKKAKQKGMKTIGFTGNDGGEMKHHCDAILQIPSDTAARVEEMHATFGRMLCSALEKKLGLVE